MSNSEKRRKEAQKKELDDNKPKWYYDACALDKTASWGEVLNKAPKKPIISHLALGEAYGNCLLKGEDALKNFLEFIGLIKKTDLLNIVGNDNVDRYFNEIRGTFSLPITDALHLATALENGCCIFKTRDSGDFIINKRKLEDYGRKYIEGFSIVEPRDSSSSPFTLIPPKSATGTKR